MSTLCFLEVSQLRTKAVDGRRALFSKKNKQTRNKSNDYFESMQYRQDLFIITHYHKRKRFTSYTSCSENHNNTSAENRKIRGLKFDTPYWRHLAAHRKI